MPINHVAGVPLGGTLWQRLTAGPTAPAASSPPAGGWGGDRSWLSRYGLGQLPGVGVSLGLSGGGQRQGSAPAAAGPGSAGVSRPGGVVPGLIGSVGAALQATANGWFQSALTYNSRMDYRLSQALSLSVASARRELSMGVREQGGDNRGPRIDLYARTAKMALGGMWCGFFVGFNYFQAGFKHPERLASTYKARRYFLYQDENQLQLHRAQGSTRQWLMFAESRGRDDIIRNQRSYPHYNANANTFTWQTIPIRPGDTVVFDRGTNSNGWPTHLGIVESYDRTTGRLTTIEGNVNNRVVRKTYDLTKASERRNIAGFGRPAAGDFGT